MKIVIEIIPPDNSWEKAEEIIRQIRESMEPENALEPIADVLIEVKSVSYV